MELKIYTKGIYDFKAWGGARELWELICMEGKQQAFSDLVLESLADENGFVDETAINDLLWFEEDFVLEGLGLTQYRTVEDEWE